MVVCSPKPFYVDRHVHANDGTGSREVGGGRAIIFMGYSANRLPKFSW